MHSRDGMVPPDELITCSDELFDQAKHHLLTKGTRAKVALTLFVGRMDLGEEEDAPLQLTIQQFEKSDELARMGKEWFARMIHKLAESGASDAVIVISEAWGLEIGDKSMSRDEAWARSEEAIEAHGGSLEHHPDRTECLLVAAYSRTHDYYRQELMLRDATGKVAEFRPIHKTITPRGEGKPEMESRFRPPKWGEWMSLEEIQERNRAAAKQVARDLLHWLRGGGNGAPRTDH